MKKILAAFFSLALIAPALSGSLALLGAGRAGVAAYQGPGDVTGATQAYVWYSCARAYNLAYANGTNSLCDLVNSSDGATAVCTLRVKTDGFVDLTGNYCTGSVDPVTACAAAGGGSCVISKAYNQILPGTRDLVQATHATRPSIVFNDLNGLPTIDCGVVATAKTLESASFSNATGGIELSAVGIRTGSFTTQQGLLGNGSGSNVYAGFSSSANTAVMNGGANITLAATDNAWHAINAQHNAGASTLQVDATLGSSANNGGNTFNAVFRFCRAGALQTAGRIAEGGLYFGYPNRTNLYNNQRTAYGAAF